MSARLGRISYMGAIVALLLPATSHAHLVKTGLGPFYDGVSHFALTPEDLLPALAMALLAGQGGSRTGRLALFALPGAWLLGGLLGLALPTISSATGQDILKTVHGRRSAGGRPYVVFGFAAESRDLLEDAAAKLAAKGLDMIAANDISAEDAGFAVETNRVTLLLQMAARNRCP